MENLIKKWRKKAKLTQQELADKLFLTRQAISQYENGKREPNFHLLEQAAKICNQPFTTTMQEEFLMKKISLDEAKEKIKGYVEQEGMFVIRDQEVEELLSIEGNVYMTQYAHKDPRKAISYGVTNFHLEEKYLKEAKGLFIMLKGPFDSTSFDDIGFLTEQVYHLVGDDTRMVFHMFPPEEGREEYEATFVAFGYPTKQWTEDDLTNKDAVFEKVMLFREKMLNKNIEEKEMVICTDSDNFLLDFRKTEVFTFVHIYKYTRKNNQDELKFMVTNKVNKICVPRKSVNPQKIANIVEQLTEKNMNELVNGSFTKIE